MGEAAPDRAPHDSLSSLTLFFQCHGTITRGLAVTCENVEVLSLVGRPGIKGETGRSTKPEHKGQTNDFMMGTRIHDVYRAHMKKSDDFTKNDHHDLLARVATPLRLLNEACDIKYEGGYQIHYNPTELRTFYFQPNDHECCRCCTKEGRSRCTYARTTGSTGSMGSRPTDKDIVWTPEYGIFPIISSDVRDYSHTVVSIHDTAQASRKRSSSSSHIPDECIEIQPKNILGKARREFWRGKIVRNSNPELAKDDRLRTKILDDFDELCETKITTIDKLINIFQLGMGYKCLYFIDPSCRNYTDERGDQIPDAETLASPARIEHMRIEDTELQKKHSMEAQQRPPSSNPSPACVTDLGPTPRAEKSSSFAIMGSGGGNKRPSRKRRSRHRRTRRKYTRRSHRSHRYHRHR